MFTSFKNRSHRLERLDKGDYTSAEYAKWQREMRQINRFLGDTRALRLALRDELKGVCDETISILDVGAGSGELLYAAGQALKGKAAFLVGAELNAAAASSIAAPRAEINLVAVQCNALALPFADDSFDFVISSLFLHHLSDDQAVTLLLEMSRVARRKFILIDLNRHAGAYYLYKAFGPILFQQFTMEDGSLSIKRSFRPGELRELALRANIAEAAVTRRFAFRLVLAGSKSGGKAALRSPIRGNG